jgi:hypothetical protein
MRSLIVLSILLLAVSLLAGCYSNPQKTNGPLFRFDTDLTSSDPQPGTTESVTLSFTILNFTDTTYTNIPWIIYLDGDTSDVVASGTISALPADAISSLISAVVAAPSGGGTHTFTAYIDPGNTLLQRTTGSDVSSVQLTFADFDLIFSVAPDASPASPTTTTPITISFSIENFNVSGTLSAATNVGYQVLEGSVVLASGTIPTIAANASVGVTAQIPLATAGLHEYTVVINPGNVILEQDYLDNTMSIAVAIPVAN